MAKIESRRIRRRITRVAVSAAAAILVFAIIAVIVLLNKSRKSGGEHSASAPDNTQAAVTQEASASVPAYTEEALSSDTETESAAPSPSATARATSAPAVSPDPYDPSDDDLSYNSTPTPVQSTEDRSLVCITAEYDAASGSLSGSCSVSFVNNTDSVMYAAYFNAEGAVLDGASIDAEAARCSMDQPGLLVLPFANELAPGGSVELYFEFAAPMAHGYIVPFPAYDTAFDAVCFIASNVPLAFSSGEVTEARIGAGFIYRVEAVSTSGVTVTPA